jgi:hypothetical protein
VLTPLSDADLDDIEDSDERKGGARSAATRDEVLRLIAELRMLRDVVEPAKRWHQAPNQIAARDALMDMASALNKMT